LATTNRNLRQEVAAGRFREDLFFRLAVIPLEVPALRQRREDIPELINYFLNCSAARLHREPVTLEPGAHDLLLGYHWPGNVRELQNIVTRASVLGGEGAISADELRPWLIAAPGNEGLATHDESPVGLSLHDMERKLIESTLEHFEGHRAKTAEALGIGLRTLSGKLKEYGYAPRARKLAKAG
jgi:DNA-binding NtrC family response regulator